MAVTCSPTIPHCMTHGCVSLHTLFTEHVSVSSDNPGRCSSGCNNLVACCFSSPVRLQPQSSALSFQFARGSAQLLLVLHK
eukprot:1159657-Pelagomonas_calceolata.AAC.4